LPNIRTYEAPENLGLNPTDRGTDATAAAARRVGAFYNQVGGSTQDLGRSTEQLGRATQHLGAQTGQLGSSQKAMWDSLADNAASDIRTVGGVITKYEDHQQISAGAPAGAKVLDGLDNQWNEIAKNADPNDQSIRQKFLQEQVEPALEKFKEGFTTENSQAWAERFADHIRTHLDTKTAADQSTLAGIAVHKNMRDMTTTMSNTALSDPSSVPTLLKGLDHTIDGMVGSSPTLSATDAARVRAEVADATKKAIVQYGAIGAIQKSGNPEATAEEWIKKYPDYISGAEAKTLASNARSQIRANNYDVEVNRRRQKEIATDRSNEATNQYLIDVRSQDPKLANDPTAKKILNDPTLLKTDKNNLLNYIDRQLKPETDTRLSQQTFVGLLRDMRAPDADPDAVMQKAWDARLTDPGKPGSMSEKDFNAFRAEVIARKTPEGAALERDRALFFKQYAGTIAGRTYDPATGSPKLYAAEVDARRIENDLRRKGLDPHLAYDPSSEYFVGRNERIAKYQGTMQSDLTDRATTPMPASAAAPAKPEGRPEPPFELRGVAALSYSKSRNMWRDDTTGELFDATGKKVGK
jgi:hypothetical protein